MSCSKIFPGDLPELAYDVIKYFQNDYSTLHSCILVNRLWCRLAIPLLWENPFSIPTKNYHFIDIYLHNLNDDLKTKLNNCIDYSLPSNTLFNYPSFLKYLNIHKFTHFVDKWFEAAISISKPENSLYPVSDFKRLINISLFKIFIENEVNFHTFEIEILGSYYSTYINNIIEFILNQNFIHNIRNLKLYITYCSEIDEIKNCIIQIIHSQQNLKEILIYAKYLSLYQSLLSKDCNCSNTLNIIIFYRINFKKMNNFSKVFEQLNVLESVHILHCSSLDAFFTKQITNLTKPFKLKSLFMKGLMDGTLSQIYSLELLLQKSGVYLENFGFWFGSNDYDYNQPLNQKLSKVITKYCKKIKFFDLRGFVSQMLNLINLSENLNYLSIDAWRDTDTNNSLLQNLGQALPYKLEYLNLDLTIKDTSYFKVFLENSQYIFINKLLINYRGSNDILHCIKKYIMKEKKVKYLAIKKRDDHELSDLEDEVKEFKSHNIRVRSYSDLFIRDIDFVKNIDYE